MKKAMLVAAAITLALTSGCAQMLFNTSPAAKSHAKSALDWWCAQPKAYREVERESFKQATFPNWMVAHCAVDYITPETTNSTP